MSDPIPWTVTYAFLHSLVSCPDGRRAYSQGSKAEFELADFLGMKTWTNRPMTFRNDRSWWNDGGT